MTIIERQIDEWGRPIFHGEDAIELLFRDCNLANLCIMPTPEIKAYNDACVEYDKLNYVVNPIEQPDETPQENAVRRQNTWWIPEQYRGLDVRAKLLALCQAQVETERVNREMDMFEERGLEPVLRLMCYLVDRWREKGVVWGVGRGSSVASYCLFLIGVHKINSIAYDLDISEFLK